MTISFKDQYIEAELKRRSEGQDLSPSLLARKDIQRYHWLLTDQNDLILEQNELKAIAQTVNVCGWFENPTLIKKFALLIEDAWRSTTDANGVYTKESIFGISVDAVVAKLKAANIVQILGLLDRCEQMPDGKRQNAH